MKRNTIIIPEILREGLDSIRDRVTESLVDKEFVITPDIEWADPTLPGMLMTYGLHRFGMPEVCLSVDYDKREWLANIADYLMTVYIAICRANSRVIQGSITDFVMQKNSREELEKFTKTIVAVEVDAKQFYDGYGLSVRSMIDPNDIPRMVQIVMTDRCGRFPDEEFYSGVVQSLIPPTKEFIEFCQKGDTNV